MKGDVQIITAVGLLWASTRANLPTVKCNYDCSIMIATSRIQRKYDHRLQAIVKSAGSVEIALEQGIPRSTARGWLRGHVSPPSLLRKSL